MSGPSLTDGGVRLNPYRRRHQLLAPARVRELSRLRPLHVIWSTFYLWSMILAAFVTVAFWPTWWAVLLAIPIIGTRYYALSIIGHDGFHRRSFTKIKVNDLFNDLCIFGPVGAITRINNRNHLRHHQFLATTNDPDLHKYGSFNKRNAWELFGYLTGASSVVRSVRNVYGGGLFIGSDNEVPRPQRRDEHYDLRLIVILVGWQLVLIGGLSASIGWWAYPVLWLLPIYVFSFLADNFRSFAEHSQPEADDGVEERRLITYLSNPVEKLFFAPMNMNYHAAHHLWPSIPYYNLPKADLEMRQRAGRALEYRGSYLAYLFRYFRSLPLAEAASRPKASPATTTTAVATESLRY